MQEKNINKKIDDALESISNIQRAAVPDYFYTRLEGRMLREKSTWETISSFITRPAIAIAAVCIILMMNFYTIISTANTEEVSAQKNVELAAVDEYSQVSSAIYEFENNTP
ncbi:MAG: hypothetical protein ABIP35_15685 [Ginsengibacter sp.]